MNRKIGISIGLVMSFAVMVAFQNCGSPQFSASQKQLSSGLEKSPPGAAISEVVIAEASLYGKVAWIEVEKVFDRSGQHRTTLAVDLTTGLMSIEKSVGTYTSSTTISSSLCTLADRRLSDLDNLLKSSRVCRANNESEGQVNCLAVADSDIQLVNSNLNESLQLRPNTCNNGIFLCDGLDNQFRSLLKDIVLNPPVACRTN